jgi:hypothetical protein
MNVNVTLPLALFPSFSLRVQNGVISYASFQKFSIVAKSKQTGQRKRQIHKIGTNPSQPGRIL